MDEHIKKKQDINTDRFIIDTNAFIYLSNKHPSLNHSPEKDIFFFYNSNKVNRPVLGLRNQKSKV